MTIKNETKSLAILVVMALTLVSAFAFIDFDGLSASGTHDINVNDWDQFKKAMKDARDAPEDTFNVTLTSAIFPDESITIPANVTVNAGADTGISILNEIATGTVYDRKVVVNEGTINLLKGEGSGAAGSIYVLGTNAVFVNKGTVTMENYTNLMANVNASIVNYGTITTHSMIQLYEGASITNDGTITLSDGGYMFVSNDGYMSVQTVHDVVSKLVNKGIIEGTGYLVLTKADAVNYGTISCYTRGDIRQGTVEWDTAMAGDITTSEGFDISPDEVQINEALRALGDRTIKDIIQDALNESLGDKANVKISKVDVDLDLTSNFIDADYPNDMTLRTAFFILDAKVDLQADFTAQLPDPGTYSFNSVPPTSERTVGVSATVTIEGMIRMDAYFDAGDQLQRVNITIGVGAVTHTDADLELSVDTSSDKYTIGYGRTDYTFGTSLEVFFGLDFNGFDLMSYNPGDQFDVKATVKIDAAIGYIALYANSNMASLLECILWSDDTSESGSIIEDLISNGKAIVDLTELFDMLFESTQTVSGIYGDSASAIPASNGLFGNTFMLSAKAVMGDDGNITLSRGEAATGVIDLGEVLFDQLESEGETSFTMSSEVNGDSMKSMFAGIIAMATGVGSSDDIEEVMTNMGAEYSDSGMTVKDMDELCDKTMDDIRNSNSNKDGENSNTVIIAIGAVVALAVLIALLFFIKKK